MKIDLKPHQEAYLLTLVRNGSYASIEEALDSLIAPAGDDAWMKPYVDEALADIDAGRVAPWSVEALRRELVDRHPELKNGERR